MLKEDCCFNTKDKKRNPTLVHYTSMETLKKMLTEEPQDGVWDAIQKKYPNIRDCIQKESGRSEEISKGSIPRFRINNCGYMNDVFEGKTFLKSIELVLDDISPEKGIKQSAIIEKYEASGMMVGT